jgi:hypothetical protein
VAKVVAAAFPPRHEHALESFLYFKEQAVAKAGRSVVSVLVDWVYVAQKVAAVAELAVNAAAQASLAELSHAKTARGASAPNMSEERIMASIYCNE